MIPNAEKIVGDYLREHADVVALDARVAGRTPGTTFTRPWVRVTQLDALNAPSRAEHLIGYLLQFDCYASGDEDGQAEASLLARTVRAALIAMPDETFADAVVTSSRITGHIRLPDPDFEKARERYIVSAEIHMHPTQ